jgi:cellulose synthase/poly-beta-1,6-N-acetylglucosamine synthase-like glycosyltransferase
LNECTDRDFLDLPVYSVLQLPSLRVYFVLPGKMQKVFFHNELKFETSFQPSVALVIPAYNEEDFILIKIKNTLELDYPRQKLTIIFITDGSTDQTPEIIRKYSEFKLMHQSEKKGKIGCDEPRNANDYRTSGNFLRCKYIAQ